MNALQVKVLYVRNLMLSTTEDSLERLFTDAVVDKMPSYSPDGAAGSCAVIERVKKIRDFAFIHFRDRELALTAMDRLNGQLTSQTITRYVCKQGNHRYQIPPPVLCLPLLGHWE